MQARYRRRWRGDAGEKWPRLRRRLLGEQARLVGLEAGVPSLEERAPLARRRRLRLQRADGCLQGGAPELLRGALLEI